MNYYALDEALSFIETGDINLEFQINDITNFLESFNFGEFEEVVTEGVKVKEAFTKVKEAIVKFLKMVKEWIVKVAKFIKNAAIKAKNVISSKFNKNHKFKDEEIDTEECFQDKDSVTEASLPEELAAIKFKKRLVKIIAPGYPLIKFSNYLDTNTSFDFDYEEKEAEQIAKAAKDFLKIDLKSDNYVDWVIDWEFHVLNAGKAKVQRRCTLNVLIPLIIGNLNDNIDTLSKIQKDADEFEKFNKEAEEEYNDAESAEDYAALRRALNISHSMFTIFSSVASVVSKAIASGTAAMNLINIVGEV